MVDLWVSSDPDTISLQVFLLNGTVWELINDAEYSQNFAKWELYWVIPEGLYLEDSAICVTAVDEVGLSGSWSLANRVIGIDPEDKPPRFEQSMPEVIYFNEDHEYILYLGEHVWDDSPSTLKAYVSNEPVSLFSVYGRTQRGTSTSGSFLSPASTARPSWTSSSWIPVGRRPRRRSRCS